MGVGVSLHSLPRVWYSDQIHEISVLLRREMSSYSKEHDVEKPVTSAGDLVSASDGGRNLLMEDDDIAFINRDSQAEEDNIKVNEEGQRQGLPKLELDEHIEVQLRFDSLNEAHLLLEDHSQRQGQWGLDFAKRVNGVLGYEAASQNIEFGSGATETCSTSRHCNVWSEATSSESVRMLLNSVRQDEVDMITEENIARGSDNYELVHNSTNQGEFSMPENASTPSKLGTDEDQTLHNKTQPDFETSMMGVNDGDQQLSSLLESSKSQQHNLSDVDSRSGEDKCVAAMGISSDGSKLEHDNSASLVNSLPDMGARRLANVESDKGCEAEGSESHLEGVDQCQDVWLSGRMLVQGTQAIGDETETGDGRRGKMTESPKGMEILYNGSGRYVTVSGYSQEEDADFGQMDFQKMADLRTDRQNNEDNTWKHVMEAVQEDVVTSEGQGRLASLLDEGEEKAGGKQSFCRDTTVADLHIRQESTLNEHSEDHTGDHHRDASQVAVASIEVEAVKLAPEPIREDALPLDKGDKEAEGRPALWEDAVVADLQARPESSMDVQEDDTGKHHGVGAEEALVSAEVQGLSDSLLDGSNEKLAGKHATGACQEDAVVVDKQARPESSTDVQEDDTGKHHRVGAEEALLSAEVQGLSDSLLDGSNEKVAGKHATGPCQEDAVVVEKQARLELSMDVKEDDTGKRHGIGAHEALVPAEVQGLSGFLLDKSNEKIAGKHATGTSQEDAVMENIEGRVESDGDNVGKLIAENSQEGVELEQIQGVSDQLPDERNVNSAGECANVTKLSQQGEIPGQTQGISDLMVDESSHDNAEMHALNASCEDVALVGMKIIQEPLSGEDTGGKQLTEASQDDVLLVHNDKKRCDGELSILVTGEESSDPGLPLEEKTLVKDDNVPAKAITFTEVNGEAQGQGDMILLSEGELRVDQEKSLKTEVNCVSNDVVSIAGNSKFMGIDTEAEADVSSCGRVRQTEPNDQAKHSEASELVLIGCSFGDSSSAPTLHAVGSTTDPTASGIPEVVGEISQISSDLNLTVEMTQCGNAEPHSIKSPIVDPTSSQNEQNQKGSLIRLTDSLVNDVTLDSAVDGPEKCLGNDDYSTQNKSVVINEPSNCESLARGNSCLFSREADQNPKTKGKGEDAKSFLPVADSETMVGVTASACNDFDPETRANNPMSKSTPDIYNTEQKTLDHSINSVSVQKSNESTLSVEKVMIDKCQQTVQIIDPSISIEEFGKNVKGHTNFDVKVQDASGTEAALSSDEQQCILTTDSGEVKTQAEGKVHKPYSPEGKGLEEAGKAGQEVCAIAIEESREYTDKPEKHEDKFEAMEVSIEVGIPLEPDNDSPAMDGDGKHFQGAAILADNDRPSSGQVNGGRSEELSFESNDVADKLDNIEITTQNLEAKSVSQSDDTFTFKVGTKGILSGKGIDVSAEFPSSGLLDKNARCWKPFQISHPIEVIQSNVSATFKAGEGQSKVFQENANANSTRKATVPNMHTKVQEGNAGRTMVKSKPVSDVEKGRQTDTVKESEKKSRSHNPKAAPGACIASIVSGSHSASIGVREEPKSSGAGLTEISSKCHLSTTVQTATLPDLNATVVPAAVLFQQPFTDSQQVQLRAQILVYGSLIQGSLPDEALMETAFTDIGGVSHNSTSLSASGRSMWENAWHIASERIHRKAFANSSEMPAHTSCSSNSSVLPSKIVEGMKTSSSSPIANVTDSRNSAILGLRSSDLAVSRNHSPQTRVGATPNIGRVGNKNTSAAIMSPPRPVTLSSPVWGMSAPLNEGMPGSNIPRTLHLDPHQMTAARHLYQPPQLGHYSPQGNATRLSHPPFPGPWIAPSQGTLSESGLPFSTFVVPDVTQETLNNRRSSVPMMPLVPAFSTMVPASTVQVGTNANADAPKGATGVTRQSSSEQKSRKRKKNRVSEVVRTSGLMPSGVEVTSVTSVSMRPPNSTPVSSASINPAPEVNPLFVTGANTSSIPSLSRYQIISRGESEQRIIFSEETSSRIEQARLSAEDAASVSATAVKHSQAIWSQLGAQKNSGLVSDREAKLASAAVAAAAAASVAKAAAAAAKVAYDAAVQAKLMAAEALNGDNKIDANHSGEVGLLEGGHSQASSTPASNMKAREKVATSSWQMREDCHSIIAAAREAAKKRVEAASAATKRAQNLDAVVRAAELAAEAVSQAGAVVAMGDPIPLTLNTLAEAGSEGYWKLPNQEASSPQKHANVQNETQSLQGIATGISEKSEKSGKHSKSKDKRDTLKKDMSRNASMKAPAKELSKQMAKDSTQPSDDACHDIIPMKNSADVQKENLASGPVQTAVAEAGTREEVVAPEAGPVTDIQTPRANEIKEGSLVEVVSDEEGLRGVWFSAKVLSLKDRKAFVCYDELLSDEGPGQLQEWIPLEGENGNAPRIRVAHPMTVIKFEGTRKRRRAAMGNYVWSVGDRVDAWIRDGWWEGIVREKREDDESKLTVYFPGEGDTTIIKAWNLRPSLVWKDGQWVEWELLKAEKDVQREDDLPSEKRQKLDKHYTEVKAKEKLQKIPDVEEGKKLQELNAVVKMSTEGTIATSIKVNQTDPQKEGSKVVFGVPKPAKKRKFMDVSKHYVADRLARNSPEGKSRFDKYKALVSHGHGGWKTTNKVEDKKAKRPMISKPKELKSGRVQDEQKQAKIEKDKNSVSNPTAAKETAAPDLGMTGTTSAAIDGSKVGRRGVMAVGHLPSSQKPGDAHTSKDVMTRRPSPSTKVKVSSATESEQGSKGKQSSASDSSSLNVEKVAFRQEETKDKIPVKAMTDNMEPRRSNRRIQPTSRLLEGLQSSPNAVKSSSSFSHEKGGKLQSKISSSILKGNVTG